MRARISKKMKQKIYSVSVAISALNEEATIQSVIKDVLAQRQKGWTLEEVVVYCDGCSDLTYEKVSSIGDKRVKGVDGRKRMGKVGRINQAMSEFVGDVLLILDADCKIVGRDVFSKIVNEFKKETKVALVGGNTRTYPPKTFFEKAIYTSYVPYFEARENLYGGHNVFGCTGACLALSRSFAKSIRIPSWVINEDTYFYFSVLERGLKFRHARGAIVRYKLAKNLKVFIKQIFRTHPEAVKAKYGRKFGDLINKEYYRPVTFYLKSILKVFRKNPLGTLYMITIKLFSKPLFRFVSSEYNLSWYGRASKKGTDKKLEKQKIIFSSYDDLKNPFYAGGGSIAIHEIARRFAKKNHTTVYTGRYPGSKDEVLDRVNYVRIGIAIGGPRLGQLIYHLLLPSYVLTQKYDLWIESFTPPFSTTFLQLFTKKPVIGLVHMLAADDMRRKYKLPFHLIERIGLKTYKRFIVLTQNSKEKISSINQKADIQIIPNGVTKQSSRKGAVKGSILFIGRLEINQKGLDLLLKAYKEVYKKTSVKLVIAGSGTNGQEKILKKLVENLGLGKGIKFIGKVSGNEKNKVFANAQMVVIPSRVETFSLVALEALSNGVPVVSFDIDGLKWLTKKCVYKVKPYDHKKFASAILKLINNTALREKMGREGKKLVKNYRWENIFKKYYQFVAQTLDVDSGKISL